MKIIINLLPEKRKKEIRKRKFLLFVIWQEILIIFTAMVFFGVLFSANLILSMNYKSIQKDGEKYFDREEFREIKRYEDEFAEVNNKVSLVDSVQNNDYYWTNFLYELSRITPEGIKLNELSSEQLDITLSGRANSRDELIVFRDRLEESDCFSEVSVPLSDIVKKEDIDFKIEVEIDKNCLKIKE